MLFSKASLALGTLAAGINALPAAIAGTVVAAQTGKLLERGDINNTSKLWDEEKSVIPVDWDIVHTDVATRANPSELDKRCEFDDGHGRMPCSFFSITFGKEDEWEAPAGKNYVTISGHGWQIAGFIHCSSLNGKDWVSVTSELPWTVDILPGYACRSDAFALFDSWKDTTVNYANQHLDIDKDSRCGPVMRGNAGMRCIIPVDP